MKVFKNEKELKKYLRLLIKQNTIYSIYIDTDILNVGYRVYNTNLQSIFNKLPYPPDDIYLAPKEKRTILVEYKCIPINKLIKCMESINSDCEPLTNDRLYNQLFMLKCIDSVLINYDKKTNDIYFLRLDGDKIKSTFIESDDHLIKEIKEYAKTNI